MGRRHQRHRHCGSFKFLPCHGELQQDEAAVLRLRQSTALTDTFQRLLTVATNRNRVTPLDAPNWTTRPMAERCAIQVAVEVGTHRHCPFYYGVEVTPVVNGAIAAESPGATRYRINVCRSDAYHIQRQNTLVMMPRAMAEQVLVLLGVHNEPAPFVELVQHAVSAKDIAESSFTEFMCAYLEVVQSDRLEDTVLAVLATLESSRLCLGVEIPFSDSTWEVGDVVLSDRTRHGVTPQLGHVCHQVPSRAASQGRPGRTADVVVTDAPGPTASKLFGRSLFCSYWLAETGSRAHLRTHCSSCQELTRTLKMRLQRGRSKLQVPVVSGAVAGPGPDDAEVAERRELERRLLPLWLPQVDAAIGSNVSAPGVTASASDRAGATAAPAQTERRSRNDLWEARIKSDAELASLNAEIAKLEVRSLPVTVDHAVPV